jgi:hypothetical protein
MVREAISEVSCRIRCHIAAGNVAVAQLDETGAQTVIAARGFHTAADEIAETLIFRARNAGSMCTGNTNARSSLARLN